MGFKIRVFGPRALFSRPELKSERYSYDVITPSAARGIIESIYWHEGLTYYIDEIKVLNPVERLSVRRNEVKSKLNSKAVKDLVTGKRNDLSLNTGDSENRTQRNSSILKNVDYIISGHFEMTDKANPSDNPGKFIDILKRRARKGQCFKQPYLGCREFPAYFELVEDDSEFHSYYENTDLVDLGIMLYDLDYSADNVTPLFYHCEMKNGIINVSGSEVLC